MRALSFTLLIALGQPVWAEAPKVVTDIAPVHSLVAMVMGDIAAPEVLLPQGADPHDFQLRPSQAQALSEAALVLWIGPELSPWLARGLDGLGAQARSVPLLAAEVTETRAFAEGADDHDHDHGHGHGQEEHKGATPDAHGEEGIDPHAWLDPENARNWLGLIAAELSALDTENSATYAANAAAGRAEIDRVEAQITATLAPVKDKPFAVFHDAYGYFIGHFGLQHRGSLREGDAAAPGAAHVKALEAVLAKEAAVCLFPEINHNSAGAEQLAQATGAKLGRALDPAGTTLEPGPALYGQMMLDLANALTECL